MTLYNHKYMDHYAVMETLQGYASPKSKLTRQFQTGELLRIRRGLYVPAETEYSIKTLANLVYGPSYISFEYALSYYGIIPERAVQVTSATYGKNKTKQYDTEVGTFIYRSIPREVFPWEVRRFEENGSPYLLATAEKAICDTLYQHRHIHTMKGLYELIIDDLRFDSDALAEIKREVVKKLAPLYQKKVLTNFARLLEKGF